MTDKVKALSAEELAVLKVEYTGEQALPCRKDCQRLLATISARDERLAAVVKLCEAMEPTGTTVAIYDVLRAAKGEL